jgi:type IV pilus assembly protein PilY1
MRLESKGTNMKNTQNKFLALTAIAAFLSLLPFSSQSQLVISDTLTGAASNYDWQALNGACLTAGNNTGNIPACVGLPYYAGKTQVGGITGRLPDAVGEGALRLTNGDTTNGSNGDYQTGAVVSNFTFPSNQGLQVTFTTVTYGGDNFNNTGADGISFFLADGTQPVSVGALGGSLGYSCSNGNSVYDGVRGGYIGIGMDEYGNFANSGDATSTGPGFRPGHISLRGAGNVNWAWLNANYPTLYPNALSAARKSTAVRTTCATGMLYNGTNNTVNINGTNIPGNTSSNIPVLNYGYIAGTTLPNTVRMFGQEAKNRPLRLGTAADPVTPLTYSLSITSAGVLNMSYSVPNGIPVPVITNRLITDNNGPLPATFRFGFSAGTGGGSNVHEITCFKASQITSASDSASVNVQQSSRVEAGTQAYLAYYHPTNWWGQLKANSLTYNASTDTVSFASLSNWDASCVLTGGSCPTTGTATTAQAPNDRQLITWYGSGSGGGVPFTWSSLHSSQQTAIGSSLNLDFLRGVRTNESTITTPTNYRARTGVLGDIVNSSPVWVGPPKFSYGVMDTDGIHGTTLPEGTTYATFASDKATRTNVVYVGANDGFLHAFRSGAYLANGNYNTASTNDGRELFGYMPSAALSTIRNSTDNLNFVSPSYAHNAFVDATPGFGDLYYAGAWHTWLVGGIGSGGSSTGPISDKTTTASNTSLYALDITDPTGFGESNAANMVIGDWTPATLPNCVGSIVNCKVHMGSTYGTPIIRRLHDGNWAVIFGNGLNSSAGVAGIFVMHVNQTTGNKTFRYLSTGRGPSDDPLNGNAKNGIAYVTSADLDNDHITDYVYGGDVFGNLWRFDLTANTASSWAADANPVFSTPAGQPITSSVTVSSSLAPTGYPRVMIGFGTGQKFPGNTTVGASYASGTQYLYGVWDWNMSDWNSKSPVKYAALTGSQSVSASTLTTQIATNVSGTTANISGFRSSTSVKVCWKGSSTCNGTNDKYGWKIALPSTNEQVIYNPTTTSGLFLVNTTVPSVSNALTCDVAPATGYTMAVTIDNGASPKTSFFANATNNYVTGSGLVISGIGLSATGTPSIVTALKKPYMINQTSSGIGSITQVNPAASGTGRRVNWAKIR